MIRILESRDQSKGIKTKKDALNAIEVMLPAKGSTNGQWQVYTDLIIDLTAKFNLTNKEIKDAQEGR